MPLLARYVAPSSVAALGGGEGGFPRLIDYELITGEDGKRTVGFGWFAGGTCFFSPPQSSCFLVLLTWILIGHWTFRIVAGVLESLSAMAQAHLELGIASPFLVSPVFLSFFLEFLKY